MYIGPLRLKGGGNSHPRHTGQLCDRRDCTKHQYSIDSDDYKADLSYSIAYEGECDFDGFLGFEGHGDMDFDMPSPEQSDEDDEQDEEQSKTYEEEGEEESLSEEKLSQSDTYQSEQSATNKTNSSKQSSLSSSESSKEKLSQSDTYQSEKSATNKTNSSKQSSLSSSELSEKKSNEGYTSEKQKEQNTTHIAQNFIQPSTVQIKALPNETLQQPSKSVIIQPLAKKLPQIVQPKTVQTLESVVEDARQVIKKLLKEDAPTQTLTQQAKKCLTEVEKCKKKEKNTLRVNQRLHQSENHTPVLDQYLFGEISKNQQLLADLRVLRADLIHAAQLKPQDLTTSGISVNTSGNIHSSDDENWYSDADLLQQKAFAADIADFLVDVGEAALCIVVPERAILQGALKGVKYIEKGVKGGQRILQVLAPGTVAKATKEAVQKVGGKVMQVGKNIGQAKKIPIDGLKKPKSSYEVFMHYKYAPCNPLYYQVYMHNSRNAGFCYIVKTNKTILRHKTTTRGATTPLHTHPKVHIGMAM